MNRRPPRLAVEHLEDRATPAVITVTNLTDDLIQGDGVSLREAVLSANNNVPFNTDVIANTTGAFGADTIVFAPGLTGAINLQTVNGSLRVTDTLAVAGPGSGLLTVAGAGAGFFSVFDFANTAAAVSVVGLTVTNGGGPVGGGFRVDTDVALEDVVIDGNSAVSFGGGVFQTSGQLSLTDVTISNNTAGLQGGGIAVVDGAPLGTQITTFGTDPIVISNNAAQSGGIGGQGGGVYLGGGVLNGTGFVFTGNQAVQGGAVYTTRGRFVVFDSTFDNNRATFPLSSQARLGGAIYSLGGLGTIDRSTFSNNAADTQGGAIYHQTDVANTLLSVTRSTFANNTQAGSGGVFGAEGGGAIAINAAATAAPFVPVELRELTIAFNRDTAGAALLLQGPGGSGSAPAASLTNSIIAANTIGTVPNTSSFIGPLADNGGNYIGTLGQADGLAPLADNGGPTQTIALLPGSPAVGAGTTAGLVGLTDQRGLPRPSGGPIDAGAFQVQTPTAGPDAYTVATGRPLSVAAPGVLANDTANDPVYPTLVVTLVTPPSANQGTVTLNPDGSFTFTPAAGFIGDATFTYAADNGVRPSAPATVTITVTPSIPPTANPDAFTAPVTGPLVVAAPGVLGNDVINDIFSPLTAVLDTAPAATQGAVALNPDGSFTFTPAAGFSGTATFSYRASDGVAQSTPATVTITVTAPVPPTANPDSFTTPAGAPLTVGAPGVLGNDVANGTFGPLTAVLDTAPAATQGAVALNPDGSFTFTPAAGFSGTATFSYRASDGVAQSTPATVTVTVPAPPVVPPPPPPPTRLYAVGVGAGSIPLVRVFNSDGSTRFELLAFDRAFDGGVRTAIGDVTGDGVDDVIVGAGTGGAPHVVVFDGTDGRQLRSFFAYDPSFRSGVHVSAGDVLGGDGVAEVVTGAGSSDIQAGGPHVVVFDGQTGATRRSFYAYADNFRGGVRVAVGELNGEPRIVTLPGPSGRPEVRVFDPETQGELTRFLAGSPAYRGGGFPAVVGGAIVTSLDSFPDFPGSVLEDLFPTLPDIDGAPTGAPASAANLTAPAQLIAFNVPLGGTPAAAQVVDVDPNFFGGLRLSPGTFQNRTGLFAATGTGGGGRVLFFPFSQGLEPPTGDAGVFGPDFPLSVYVGGPADIDPPQPV